MMTIRYYRSPDIPNRIFQYQAPSQKRLKKYPCCLDATVTTGLRTLIQDDNTFAHLKLMDGLRERRKALKRGVHITSMTLGELLRAGYIFETVPQKKISLRTVERNRSRAALFCSVFENTTIGSLNEEFFWLLHAMSTFGYKRFNGQEVDIQLKDVKALRKGIHALVKKQVQNIWFFPRFDWDWLQHPDLKGAVKSTQRLRTVVMQNRGHPKHSQYLRFFHRGFG